MGRFRCDVAMMPLGEKGGKSHVIGR